ncbi:MAG: glycosyltransferase, partial [Deltaproteobacteria bacterium]
MTVPDRVRVQVSVVIPAHNAAATLAETLESLHAQTFQGWEAIIVDDGS